MPMKDFDDIFAINVRSVFMVTKRALPHIIKNKGMYGEFHSFLTNEAHCPKNIRAQWRMTRKDTACVHVISNNGWWTMPIQNISESL